MESTQNLKILNIAFYHFMDLDLLLDHRKCLQKICQELELKGTILLSSEGINGNLAGQESHIREFQKFFSEYPIGKNITYKESYSNKVPFEKLFIKLKKEIIPVGDATVKPAQMTAPRISPQDLKRWLDENRDFELLDTRNDYEIKFGTFKKAQQLGIKHFRQFANELKNIPEENKDKPLVMFCTGGIRCEKASVIAIRHGFKEVYQLDGGILKYFEKCGDSHYKGECFVFDERVSLDSRLQEKREANVE